MAVIWAGTSLTELCNDSGIGFRTNTESAQKAPYTKEGCASTTTQSVFAPVQFSAQSELWFTMHFAPWDNSQSNDSFIEFKAADGTVIARMTTYSDETVGFEYNNGSGFTEVGRTTGPREFVLYRYDLQMTLDNTTGAFRIYENKILLGEVTGDTILTAQSTISIMQHNAATGSDENVISGMILADEDTRLMTLEQLDVTGAGSNSDFTGAYTDVDGTGLDDSNLLTSTTAGDISTFAMENHNTAFDSGYDVAALVVSLRANGLSGTQIQPACRSGSTDGRGTASNLSVVNENHQHVFSTNPATGLAWTEAEINSAEVGCAIPV